FVVCRAEYWGEGENPAVQKTSQNCRNRCERKMKSMLLAETDAPCGQPLHDRLLEVVHSLIEICLRCQILLPTRNLLPVHRSGVLEPTIASSDELVDDIAHEACRPFLAINVAKVAALP